ncbi:hypothetical protein E4U57_006769 [Claviceps arundinis]|uniref:Uncharacterized protein n=1 Tax=Claviceps arundinis TaxID=1623583 RepID=A0ABQ7PGG5_9HYPO|nr:hypothetical protein E4U57_006769 [Claviceps arundinis]
MVLNVFSQDDKHHKGYRPVLFGKNNTHKGKRACGQDDEVLVGQQSVRLQMEVHTPQQHKNAKVKWLNSKKFLGKPRENRDEAFLPISGGTSNDY